MNDQQKIARGANGRLIAAGKLNGTEVCSPEGERLGSIDDVMIDRRTGQVAYFLMSFGGFLGIGEKLHPLPWSIVTLDTATDRCIVRVGKDILKNAPSYAAHDRPDYEDRAWGAQLHRYYDVTPYWDDSGASERVRREAHVATGSGPMHSESDESRGRSRGR